MNAGRLSTPIVIQQPATGVDQIGQPLTGWVDFALVWAHVRHLSGVESIKAGGTVSAVQASMRIRYRADVHAGMRVMHGLTVYEIRAVLPDVARREYVDLVCQVVS